MDRGTSCLFRRKSLLVRLLLRLPDQVKGGPWRSTFAATSQLRIPVERKGEPLRFALRFPSLAMITSIVISPATGTAIWHGIVRASRNWNAHRDDGDRQCERECYLAQHDQSPCVEAGFGFCGLDRGTRHLFPRLYSNVVCLVQVFVCSGKCADHIRVIRLCNRTSRAILVAMFRLFDTGSAREERKVSLSCQREVTCGDYYAP
jgi:hypothetical protein